MRLTNLNPGDDIGASAWLVEMDGRCLLLDSGMHPRHEGHAALPLFDTVAERDVEAIALSHCHHDHCGSLPIALRHWPRAQVWMPELSYFLIERVLHNSVNVMKRQRVERGVREYPLYHHRELDELAYLFQGFRYHRPVTLGEGGPEVEFHDAGHVLGSAGIEVRGRREGLFYTGDVCFAPQTLQAGAQFEKVRSPVLLMETTRGATPTPEGFTREAEVKRLLTSIAAVLERGGSVLLPTFALGRTQEILALLALAIQDGDLPRRPVYVGGMGRVFTEITDLEAHRAPRQHPDLNLHEALGLTVLEERELPRVKLSPGRLFVLTAGMLSERTPAHELALRLLPDERHAIFFVGYADPETPGGRMKASHIGEPFFYSDMAGEVTRHCELQTFDLTAHAQRGELADFAAGLNPRTIVLGHGDPDARAWMADTLSDRCPKAQIHQPAPGEALAL